MYIAIAAVKYMKHKCKHCLDDVAALSDWVGHVHNPEPGMDIIAKSVCV